MTNPTLERMARAIHAASYHPFDRSSSIVEEHWEFERGKALKRAKAVLSVLLEPDEAMIEAGEELIPWSRGTETRFMAPGPEDIFTAMINSIQEGE